MGGLSAAKLAEQGGAVRLEEAKLPRSRKDAPGVNAPTPTNTETSITPQNDYRNRERENQAESINCGLLGPYRAKLQA
jgi:hypothetical protein